MGAVASLLAWPSDSGVAGGAIGTVALGVPAYARHRFTARREHAERLAQAERHHTEAQAQATAHHNALTSVLRLPVKRPTARGGS